MSPHASAERFQLVTEVEGGEQCFLEDLRSGLLARPKTLPCRWFYDEAGSRLFEQICELPEYYLTRCERSILEEHAAEIAGRFERPATLVELGSGSASKTRRIIEAFLEQQDRLVFAPIDISRGMLTESAQILLEDYPELDIRAFAGRYETGLESLASWTRAPRLTLWLGSSVGNLDRAQAASFLRGLSTGMHFSDRLLIGIDLRKDPRVLEAAYDDSQGVTARFNRNLLVRVNRELGGHFDPESFSHRASWQPSPGRVESHLVSRRDQQVRIETLGLEVSFTAGETIHTENSYKYSREEIETSAREAGMLCEAQWLDKDALYSLNLFAPAQRSASSA